MLAVNQLEKCAIRNRAGHVAQLGQPMETQLPHAREVAFPERRPRDDLSEQLERALPISAENRQTDDRRVRPDVRLDLCAKPGERFMHLDRRPIAAAFVEHVGRECRQAFLSSWIVGRAATNEQHERDQRHLQVANGPYAKPTR